MLFIISNINGQITDAYGNLLFEDTLTFQPRSSWINIPDSGNIWEIGTPEKIYFDSGYKDKVAILTDTTDFYSSNCNDYFSITIPWSGYPNPSINYIEFKLANKTIEGYSFSLFDTNGKLVKSIAIVNQRIDISDLSKGTYFCRLQKGNIVFTGKVVKN